MCVIMAKPKGIDMPSDDTIHNMWVRNPDGAGFMYAKDGQVHIEKGFMKLDALRAALKKTAKSVDLKNTAVVMHFRITTHGGTKPENCHPFPITDSIGKLKKLKQDTRIGVAHNGIISSVTPRKGISDTMEYIATQLAPLSRAVPKFYTDANLMLMIQNATASRLAFLTGGGKIYTIGQFITDGGRLYSNSSYEPWIYKQYTGKAWGDWCDYGYEDDCEYERLVPADVKNPSDYVSRTVDYLSSVAGDFVVSPDGTWYDGEDWAVDESGVVYVSDYELGYLVPALGFTAYTFNGMPYKFDENHGCVCDEVIYLGDLDDAPWDDDGVF